MRVSIAMRLAILGLYIGLAVCFLVGDVYYTSTRVSASTQVSAMRLEQLDAVQEMRTGLLQMTLAAMDAIVDKHEGDIAPERMQAITSAADHLTRSQTLLQQIADTQEERRAVREFGEHLPALIQGVTVELPATIRTHGRSTDAAAAEAFERIDDVVDDHADAVLECLDTIADSIRQELTAASAALEADVAAAVSTSMWVGGGVLLTVGLFFTIIARSILTPLQATLEFAQAVAGGDLDRQITVRSSDETGRLAEALRVMVASLKQSLQQATQQGEEARLAARAASEATQQAEQARQEAERAMAKGMLQAADRLEEVVGIVSSASEELAAQVEESSQGAAQQSHRITEAATAMEEMNATVLEVARSASVAADSADAARRKAVEGAEVVSRVVAGVTEVSAHSQHLKTDMADLGQKAEGIGQVLGVISDIADQTNLLALNAAIEAALCRGGRRSAQAGRKNHAGHPRGGYGHSRHPAGGIHQHRQRGKGCRHHCCGHWSGRRLRPGAQGNCGVGGSDHGSGALHRHRFGGTVCRQRRDRPKHRSRAAPLVGGLGFHAAERPGRERAGVPGAAVAQACG
ncbi:putative methyl-accepting chemotaxis protein [Megalodesulfovibrio gigas DSM 1382 = ATCC 19364]|uniref:Putative methyl-accepting chemotaxis protein n=1 Tax=Megalodesulfovibrio gigas (strain ATCC 19364 / DSM 1382 / NCIMB 9332 / VKM B-1759) TaxID=1121448 RepID=T2GCY7_MEGG1|nr:putative methyl-accepting chemotaxis protein [Megalodesulfovibrio gigas DSM 1382 = ATCC 19364]